MHFSISTEGGQFGKDLANSHKILGKGALFSDSALKFCDKRLGYLVCKV
jgi:hypothetical protein